MQQQQNKNDTDTIQRNYRQILFQNSVKITQKKFDMKYTHIVRGPYNEQ